MLLVQRIKLITKRKRNLKRSARRTLRLPWRSVRDHMTDGSEKDLGVVCHRKDAQKAYQSCILVHRPNHDSWNLAEAFVCRGYIMVLALSRLPLLRLSVHSKYFAACTKSTNRFETWFLACPGLNTLMCDNDSDILEETQQSLAWDTRSPWKYKCRCVHWWVSDNRDTVEHRRLERLKSTLRPNYEQ